MCISDTYIYYSQPLITNISYINNKFAKTSSDGGLKCCHWAENHHFWKTKNKKLKKIKNRKKNSKCWLWINIQVFFVNFLKIWKKKLSEVPCVDFPKRPGPVLLAIIKQEFSQRPTAVWYTLQQGVIVVANLPEKLPANIMAWQLKSINTKHYGAPLKPLKQNGNMVPRSLRGSSTRSPIMPRGVSLSNISVKFIFYYISRM